jgi:hypothetical protein
VGPSPWEDSQVLRWTILWGASIGSLGVLDYVRSTRHDGTTVSEITRAVLATDTALGKVVFCTALAVFARHILR